MLFFKKYYSVQITDIGSFAEYAEFSKSLIETYERRKKTEVSLITNDTSFHTRGFCYVCNKKTKFLTDFLYSDPRELIGTTRIPNWRERVVCSACNLNNRIRASIQFLEERLDAKLNSKIYITEQTTPLFSYLDSKYSQLCGSEYLGDEISFGESNKNTRIRNESITKLTFNDESFDFILSFDVFEHVPEYKSAFAECMRCLKPGGVLLFTVPFDKSSIDNLVRAKVDRYGNIQHIMKPEYHGDPVNQEGCLCFFHFGWEMLDQVRQIGFTKVQAHFFWSRELGYLGGEQILFTARR